MSYMKRLFEEEQNGCDEGYGDTSYLPTEAEFWLAILAATSAEHVRGRRINDPDESYVKAYDESVEQKNHVRDYVVALYSRISELEGTLELCQRALQLLASQTHLSDGRSGMTGEADARLEYAAKYSAIALETLQLRTRASHSEQGA